MRVKGDTIYNCLRTKSVKQNNPKQTRTCVTGCIRKGAPVEQMLTDFGKIIVFLGLYLKLNYEAN